MATFGGSNYRKLPAMYQHFLVPVYPNLGRMIYIDGKAHREPHVHSSPDWESHHNQWILLMPFEPSGEEFEDLPTWQSEKMLSGAHFDGNAMKLLRAMFRSRKVSWKSRMDKNSMSWENSAQEIHNSAKSARSRASKVQTTAHKQCLAHSISGSSRGNNPQLSKEPNSASSVKSLRRTVSRSFRNNFTVLSPLSKDSHADVCSLRNR
ncbi:hypothetical protein C8J57DRAFT_1312915 [Mycena rebaudengoi]|nr:hypothetical protein C8J57DRAFT_1312915 [Mycena rebaudengoi]